MRDGYYGIQAKPSSINPLELEKPACPSMHSCIVSTCPATSPGDEKWAIWYIASPSCAKRDNLLTNNNTAIFTTHRITRISTVKGLLISANYFTRIRQSSPALYMVRKPLSFSLTQHLLRASSVAQIMTFCWRDFRQHTQRCCITLDGHLFTPGEYGEFIRNATPRPASYQNKTLAPKSVAHSRSEPSRRFWVLHDGTPKAFAIFQGFLDHQGSLVLCG